MHKVNFNTNVSSPICYFFFFIIRPLDCHFSTEVQIDPPISLWECSSLGRRVYLKPDISLLSLGARLEWCWQMWCGDLITYQCLIYHCVDWGLDLLHRDYKVLFQHTSSAHWLAGQKAHRLSSSQLRVSWLQSQWTLTSDIVWQCQDMEWMGFCGLNG